jgi:hypothetical protein
MSIASTKDTDSGPVCKNIIACCPEGTKEVGYANTFRIPPRV